MYVVQRNGEKRKINSRNYFWCNGCLIEKSFGSAKTVLAMSGWSSSSTDDFKELLCLSVDCFKESFSKYWFFRIEEWKKWASEKKIWWQNFLFFLFSFYFENRKQKYVKTTNTFWIDFWCWCVLFIVGVVNVVGRFVRRHYFLFFWFFRFLI